MLEKCIREHNVCLIMLYNQQPTAVHTFIRLFGCVQAHSYRKASTSQARPHVSIIFHEAESSLRN
jgi:hypothetical protein